MQQLATQLFLKIAQFGGLILISITSSAFMSTASALTHSEIGYPVACDISSEINGGAAA